MYRGYEIRGTEIWWQGELISRAARSVEEAKKIIDGWLYAR